MNKKINKGELVFSTSKYKTRKRNNRLSPNAKELLGLKPLTVGKDRWSAMTEDQKTKYVKDRKAMNLNLRKIRGSKVSSLKSFAEKAIDAVFNNSSTLFND